MPYRRPYRPRRSQPYRRRPYRSRKKTVLANARRVQRLERRVTTLSKHEKVWGTYQKLIAPALTQPYYSINLMDIATWSATFGNPDIVENTDQFNLTSITHKISMVPSTENGLIDMTVFVVSPQKHNARKVVSETSNGANLTSGVDYIQDNYGTGTILNLERWKVHRTKKCYTRIEFGTQEPAAPTPTRKMTFRIPWKVPLKSGTGNWRTTITNVNDINSDCQLYVFIFNNNSGLNLAYPAAYTNTLFSGYAIA